MPIVNIQFIWPSFLRCNHAIATMCGFYIKLGLKQDYNKYIVLFSTVHCYIVVVEQWFKTITPHVITLGSIVHCFFWCYTLQLSLRAAYINLVGNFYKNL